MPHELNDGNWNFQQNQQQEETVIFRPICCFIFSNALLFMYIVVQKG
ncbi:hypothetical protein KIS1582_1885 [Cytobacillus firmus]|uniref:Uncharacterized protein n=1 Tax=Cytobacillus firmus TaxID=1399 RepID=A0A800MXP6_CYTFI|nr:hypothetical protein KIS1582_1885 [Cytobacillus firmus]